MKTSENKLEISYESTLVCQNTRHFGNTLPLKFNKEGQPRYLLGPQYYIFIITFIITTVIQIFMITLLILGNVKVLSLIVCIASSLFQTYCYFKVGVSEPGLASRAQQASIQDKQDENYCIPCRCIRTFTTKHCYYCDVCIIQYDHHCPWVGKCIGKNNKFIFRLFLFSLCQVILVYFISSTFQ